MCLQANCAHYVQELALKGFSEQVPGNRHAHAQGHFKVFQSKALLPALESNPNLSCYMAGSWILASKPLHGVLQLAGGEFQFLHH